MDHMGREVDGVSEEDAVADVQMPAVRDLSRRGPKDALADAAAPSAKPKGEEPGDTEECPFERWQVGVDDLKSVREKPRRPCHWPLGMTSVSPAWTRQR